MTGFIKLERKLLDNWVANDPESLAVWVRFLTLANFKDQTKMINKQLVTVKRGQFIFGLNKFSEASNVTISKLRRVIKNLEKDGMIDKQNFNKYSIISITNYDDYQADDKQTTSRRQADDKQTTILEESKESKESKEYKNNIKKRGSRIVENWNPKKETIKQVVELHEAYEIHVIEEVDTFVNYYIALSGTKAIKINWDTTFKNWCKQPYCAIHEKKRKMKLSEKQESFVNEKNGTGW